MAQYCTCATCVASVAQPAQRVQANMESVQGARVVMQQGWMLVHWSGANFTEMKSTEIHNFIQRGYKYRVGASFYLYTGAIPNRLPMQLRQMGLGGNNRYTIDSAIGNTLNVFYKANAAANPAEVAVVLGCGGEITFDGQGQATGTNVNDGSPIITII